MDKQQKSKSMETKPEYVQRLEAAYGAPSQAGFGSAVFFESLPVGESLELAALVKYRYFVGDSWQRFGEQAWMSAWRQVYARPEGVEHNVVAELRSITDPEAAQSAPMILDVVENAEAARQALSAAYDDPDTVELRCYNLGDGAAMSGILVAGRRTNGETTLLVFLLD